MKKVIAGAILAVVSISVSAVPMTVSGITWDPDLITDFNAQSAANYSSLSIVGDVLTAIGRVTDVNSIAVSGGTELTWMMTAIVTGIGDLDSDVSTPNTAILGSLTVDFFADPLANFDFSSIATATDGTLFLSTTGVDVPNPGGIFGVAPGTGELFLANNSTTVPGGTFLGLLDVVGGTAAAFFDTDGEGFGADLTMSGSFQPFKIAGLNAGLPNTGTTEFVGNSVPEPGSMALLGLGLLGFAATAKRKQKRVTLAA